MTIFFLTKFVPFDLFQEEPVKADSDEDMINVNGELSFTAGVMVRPTSGSMISNEPSGAQAWIHQFQLVNTKFLIA